MKSILLGIAAMPLALGMLTVATGLAVVDVRQGGPDGHRIVVPVPLLVANTALMFADDVKTDFHCPKFAEYHRAATLVAKELQSAPDTRFVEVEQDSQHVTIDKVGNILEVRVTDGGDKVHVRVPIAGIERLLESYDGERFNAQGLVAALREFPHGECVNVQNGEDRVRIWIF